MTRSRKLTVPARDLEERNVFAFNRERPKSPTWIIAREFVVNNDIILNLCTESIFSSKWNVRIILKKTIKLTPIKPRKPKKAPIKGDNFIIRSIKYKLENYANETNFIPKFDMETPSHEVPKYVQKKFIYV